MVRFHWWVMGFAASCVHLKHGCESWTWANRCCHPTIYVAAAVGGQRKLRYPCTWVMWQYRFYFWDVLVFPLSHTLYLLLWAHQTWDSCDLKGRPPQIHMVLCRKLMYSWLTAWQHTQLRTSVIVLINEKLSCGGMDFTAWVNIPVQNFTSWVNCFFPVNLFSCFGMWGKVSPIHDSLLFFFFFPLSLFSFLSFVLPPRPSNL